MSHARFARRAVLRAALAAGFGALVPRRRVAAALGAAAAGAAIEMPVAGIPLAAAAALTRDARGVAAGVTIGALTTRVWPTAPRTVEELRRHNTKVSVAPNVDGAGVVVVVNQGAGSAAREETADAIRGRLPAAEVIEPAEDDDIAEVMAKAAARATAAFGAAGGDGTISTAAALAAAHDVPLLALPAGTLNHFARDLGVLDVDHAIDALQDGQLVVADLARIGDATFVNTASFGAYTDLVEARERLEDRIGKWPAVAVSLVGVLRRAEPVTMTVDGRRRRLWLGFVGNGRYQPSGFAPSWREALDDGLVDVRLVDADAPLARVRLVLAVLTGRLGRTTVYEQRLAARVHLACDDSTLRIALDGELTEVPSDVRITCDATVRVFAPHR